MIILLNPKSANYGFRVPNTLLYLGALLEGHYEYDIIDQNLDKNALETICNLIREKKAKYLCITVMPGPQLHHAVPISMEVKKLFPHVTIIWGGYFPTFHPNTVLRSSFVDYLFKGNAEPSFMDFIDMLEKKPGAKSLSEMKGLSYRDSGSAEGKFIHNERGETTDPDTIPLLPYYKAGVENYMRLGKTYLGKRTIGYISSIGCPFLCGFCAIAGIHKGRWHGRSSHLVYQDLKFLKDNYNIGAVEFNDDNFFVSEKRAVQIAEKIIPLELGWWGEARPDTMMKYSDESLTLLRKSGLKMVFFGAESSSAETLKLMNKGGTQTPDTVLQLAARFKQFDIIPEFSFVLGSPSDNVDADLDKDINFIRKIKEINPDSEIIFYIYSPVNFDDSEISLASKMKGFGYPKTLEEWLSPEWKNFDVRKYAQTPWLKPRHITKIKNFERTLNGAFPTKTDTKIRGWKRGLMHLLGDWRYKAKFYTAPLEIRVVQKLFKYRQPEIEGFAYEN